MSDLENLSDASSATTIENMPFDTVVANLRNAAKDAIDTEDYLSYSTLIDLYLGEPTRYTFEERETLLEELLTILQTHRKLTYEIGWDLPSIFMQYVVSDWDFEGPLRSSPCVYKIFKLFECLALYGNPKELFLKGCELLSSIKIADAKNLDIESRKSGFFDVKVYCLVEMINSNLKAINTLYPSRFLSMYLSSLINLIHNNYINSQHDPSSLLKRIYGVCRNYNSPPVPKDTSDYSADELAQIKADEEYLQRKLLKSFVTNAMSSLTRWTAYELSVDLFYHISNKDYVNPHQVVVVDRLAELCGSYDTSLSTEFKGFLTSTHTLFHTIDFSGADDDVVGELFEKITIDYQQNVITSMTDSDSQKIRECVLGYVIYFTRQSGNPVDFNSFNITFNDALVISLRLLIPSMVNPAFGHVESQDIAVFWSWYAIQKSVLDKKSLELELAGIPKLLLTTYFQVLLHIFILNPDPGYKDFKFVVLTLLTKVLASSPEELTFSFIRDSLTNCPYSTIQAALIGIMKELLTKDKAGDDELAGDLSKVDLKSAPPLPSRETPKKVKFLTLTPERLNNIFDLTNENITKTFQEVSTPDSDTETETDEADKVYELRPQYLSSLSAYLNLFVVLKKDAVVVANNNKLTAIVDRMSNIIKGFRVRSANSKSMELNAVDILSITVDRIKGQ